MFPLVSHPCGRHGQRPPSFWGRPDRGKVALTSWARDSQRPKNKTAQLTMDPTVVPKKLWEHPDPTSTAMYGFMQRLNREHNAGLSTFADLHRFSVSEREIFWSTVWDAANYIHSGSYDKSKGVVDHSQPIDAVPRWFEGVSLNWAENSLYFRDRTVSG
ncbi:hypothetical protein MAPG_09073, partial [Magnaporthiopsis poae ATCC 64411]